MTLFIASVSVALIISFFCSLCEAAVLSIGPGQIARMTDSHPAIGKIWEEFKRNIDRPISVILFLNTSAHTIGASVAGAQFDEIYGDEWIWAFSLGLTFVMLQYTELAPKTLGVRYNYQIALVAGRPLSGLIKVFSPIMTLLHLLNRPFNRGQKASDSASTIEELNSMASYARLSKVINQDQEEIIKNVPKLNHLTAIDVMIPVDQVAFLKSEQTLSEALKTAQTDSHTRFPVYSHDDKNSIVGYVNFKEMVFHSEGQSANSKLAPIRPVHFITPETSAKELLKLFVDEHAHIGIVKQNGLTLGLITLEDIIEEVLGDIEDEFDKLPKMFQEISPNSWQIGGGYSLKELSNRFGIHFETKKKFLSSWMTENFESPPKTGDVVRAGSYEFIVKRIRRGKVFEASVVRK